MIRAVNAVFFPAKDPERWKGLPRQVATEVEFLVEAVDRLTTRVTVRHRGFDLLPMDICQPVAERYEFKPGWKRSLALLKRLAARRK